MYALSSSKANPGERQPAASGTLILALGNSQRGDDGAAADVLKQLRQKLDVLGSHHAVELVDGGLCGWETVLLLQGYSRAIMIDAAEMGAPQGAWRRMGLEDLAFERHAPLAIGAVHSAGLAAALQLGSVLGILPPHLELYAIQAANLDWGAGLSLPVAAACREVAGEIFDRLTPADPCAVGTQSMRRATGSRLWQAQDAVIVV